MFKVVNKEIKLGDQETFGYTVQKEHLVMYLLYHNILKKIIKSIFIILSSIGVTSLDTGDWPASSFFC